MIENMVLNYIEECDGRQPTLKEIREDVGCSAASLFRVIKSLERQNLVARSKRTGRGGVVRVAMIKHLEGVSDE